MSGYSTPTPELRIDDLGAGWQQTEAALAAIQADLTRTVADAPHLILLWHDREDGERHACLGKAADWYLGSTGGLELGRHYVDALVDLAYELREAVQDNLLGYLTDWPLCPRDGWTLTVAVDADQTCTWVCEHGGHVVAEVGRLGA